MPPTGRRGGYLIGAHRRARIGAPADPSAAQHNLARHAPDALAGLNETDASQIDLPPLPALPQGSPVSIGDPQGAGSVADPSAANDAAIASPTQAIMGTAADISALSARALDELADRLYEPLTARLKTELWLDRERSGLLVNLRR